MFHVNKKENLSSPADERASFSEQSFQCHASLMNPGLHAHVGRAYPNLRQYEKASKIIHWNLCSQHTQQSQQSVE